jgi:hypothetical protein
MKKKLLYVIPAVLFFVSCKKDNATNPPPAPQEPVTQIASIKQTRNNDAAYDLTKEFFYDSEGRLKEIKYSGANSNMAGEKYTYSGNTAQYRYLVAGTEYAYASVDYTLSNNGVVEKKLYPVLQIGDQYEYNSAGFITRQTYLRNGSGDGYAIYHYSGNNVLDSISGFTAAGIKTIAYVFTYTTGVKNSTGNESMGLKMLGKDQAFLLETKTAVEYQNGIRRVSSKNVYSFILYPDGRIQKITNLQYDFPPGSASVSFIKEILLYTYKQ